MQNVGVAGQKIVALEEGRRIKTEIRFKKPFESNDRMFVTTKSNNGGSTKVTFGYEGTINYPTNLLTLKSLLEEGKSG